MYPYRLPMKKQLEEYCVPIIHTIDNEVHWFYYKHIVSLNEQGLKVKFGKKLKKEAFYPASDIINLNNAIKRYNEITEKYR